MGVTTVTCTATDSLARVAACSFTVTVTQTRELAATRFLAFGDSLTSGTTSPDPTTLLIYEPDSYPFKLENLLTLRYPAQRIEVLNEGCAGEFTDRPSQNCVGGVTRLPGLLRQYTPQAVLLLHGANNLLNFEDDGIPDIVSALDQMISQIQGSGATAMVATLPPQDIRGSRGQGADEVPLLNSEIVKLAQRRGAVVVDLFRLLGGSPAGIIGVDGLHPTRHGYDVIAGVWLDAIVARFERASAGAVGVRSGQAGTRAR